MVFRHIQNQVWVFEKSLGCLCSEVGLQSWDVERSFELLFGRQVQEAPRKTGLDWRLAQVSVGTDYWQGALGKRCGRQLERVVDETRQREPWRGPRERRQAQFGCCSHPVASTLAWIELEQGAASDPVVELLIGSGDQLWSGI